MKIKIKSYYLLKTERDHIYIEVMKQLKQCFVLLLIIATKIETKNIMFLSSDN